MPTTEQLITSLRTCQWVTTCYLPISFIRHDNFNQEVYIEAGEEIRAIIHLDGGTELYEF